MLVGSMQEMEQGGAMEASRKNEDAMEIYNGMVRPSSSSGFLSLSGAPLELSDIPGHPRVQRVRLCAGEWEDRTAIDHEPLRDFEGWPGEKSDHPVLSRKSGGPWKAVDLGDPPQFPIDGS